MPTAATTRPDSDHHVQPDGRVHGVVAAIPDAQGRWLLIRRSDRVAAPLKVCFPGGGVDPGETHRDALVREIREELRIEVNPLRAVWTHVAADRPLTLFGWICSPIDQQPDPDPREVAEVLWLDADRAADHPDAMPNNADFLEALRSAGFIRC